MENKPDRCAGTMEGTLPGKCASLVFPYVPMQDPGAEKYDQKEGLAAGTLFPGLNMPFFRAIKTRMNCDNTALCELMALSFAATELGLYLDTHREDTEALELYRKYVSMLKEGKARYEGSAARCSRPTSPGSGAGIGSMTPGPGIRKEAAGNVCL